MKLLNYVFEASLSSKHKWTHFRVHKYEYYKHLVWGPVSIVFGQPHLMPMTVCAHCYEEIVRVGEDYLDYCESCNQIEGDTLEITTEEYETFWA